MTAVAALALLNAVVGAETVDSIIAASLNPVNGVDAYRKRASVYADVIEVSRKEFQYMLNAPRKFKKAMNTNGTLVSPRSRRGRREAREHARLMRGIYG